MRKILHYGICVDTRKSIIGKLSTRQVEGKAKHFILLEDNYNVEKEVFPESICEWVGLFDKNFKKIFEHNIVVFGGMTYEIIFEHGSFCLHDREGEIIRKIGGIDAKNYSLWDLYQECCWENKIAFDLEVIGTTIDKKI